MHFLEWYPQLHYIRGRYSRRPAVNARSLHESTCFVDMLAETRPSSRWCLETRAVVRVRFHRSMARFCFPFRAKESGYPVWKVFSFMLDDFSFLKKKRIWIVILNELYIIQLRFRVDRKICKGDKEVCSRRFKKLVNELLRCVSSC